jgi:hypothetical protein
MQLCEKCPDQYYSPAVTSCNAAARLSALDFSTSQVVPLNISLINFRFIWAISTVPVDVS